MHSNKHTGFVWWGLCVFFRFWVHKALPSSKSKISPEICDITQSGIAMTFKDIFMLIGQIVSNAVALYMQKVPILTLSETLLRFKGNQKEKDGSNLT